MRILRQDDRVLLIDITVVIIKRPNMTDPQHQAEAASTINPAAWIGYFLGPVFLLIALLTDPPGGMPQGAWLAVGLTLLMATWWSTEAIPIPATSLLPIILVPALGLGTVKEAAAPFADPVIFLFLGGFVIGLAMQRWNLHKRIALMTLLAVRSEERRVGNERPVRRA